MSNELLEKVISTSVIGANGTGGLLTPEQSGTFIDYMWDATVLGGQVRTIRMRANEVELDRMAIGERLVRLATEAVDDAVNPVVAFTKVSLSTRKLRLDWELSSESLEDGLEGEALEDHIARLMASQAANDLEDLAINGDVAAHRNDALLKSFDGWRKRLYYGGQVVDADGAELDKLVFHRALRAMPRRFMARRGTLKWFTSAGLLSDYVYNALFVESPGQLSVDQRDVAQVNREPFATSQAGWSPASPFGISAQEVPLFPEYTLDGTTDHDGDTGSDVWLVDPNNLIWGVKRAIQVFREFVPRKDTIEYTMYTRVGCTVENPLASVVVKNVAYRDS
jgi:hypothetical protein